MQQGAEYTAETLADYGGSEFRAGARRAITSRRSTQYATCGAVGGVQ